MNQLESFAVIKTLIFDVDGVFTDNTVLVTETGEMLRRFNVRDGLSVRLAVEAGYQVIIISGGKSEGVRLRFQGLGVQDINLGIQDKLDKFTELQYIYNFNPVEVLYMGDDYPDYPVMRRVGVACCPQDACPELLEIANYVSPFKGGEGCVRDVIEKVMRIQGTWNHPQ